MKNLKFLLVAVFCIFNFSCVNTQKTLTDKHMENKDTKVLIKTTMGDITVRLYDSTPVHRDNFLKLVSEKYFDSILFHRVIPDFMVQSGDPDSKNAKEGVMLGNGGPDYTLPAELTPMYFHKRGALSAARTGDQGNPCRRSSGSQFYIVTGKVYTDAELNTLESRMNTKFTPEQRKAYTTVGGTPFLDGQYTVFGEVVDGIDVAVAISKVPRDKNDRPNKDVRILSMEIVK